MRKASTSMSKRAPKGEAVLVRRATAAVDRVEGQRDYRDADRYGDLGRIDGQRGDAAD
jgi:hypothetical protein